MAETQLQPLQATSNTWQGATGRTRLWFGFFLVTCYLLLATHALALDDPTEPPPNYQAKLQNSQPGSVGDASGDPRQRWLLTSTLTSPQRRVAVMNGHAVKPGDVLDGATVVEIELATVHLRDTQGDFSVTMQPAAVKMPSGRTTTPQP